ncbi:MAG: pyridoxal phosphate-dependent aminotransferase [bacterium]|nr:pyridoxal phosphate-dependent aminotransferase [bacterium]
MIYDFDKIISREGTGSVKWELAPLLYAQEDILPMWVADMDFEAPKPVMAALAETAQKGVYGYTYATSGYSEAIIEWIKKRHNWTIQKNWLAYAPGVVPALNMLINTFSNPGDKIIIQPPVYYPFMSAIKNNGRQIIDNPLVLSDGKYHIDFDDLEKKAATRRAEILILCSPHNPVGRVWTKEELTRIGEICIKNDILVISDEIHFDLVRKGFLHTCFASISEEFLMNSITCTAPSKTFNLAGLQTSNLVIPDLKKKNAYQVTLEKNGIMGPNLFGAVALEAAYRESEDWLEQLLVYLEKNLAFMKDFISQKIPSVTVPEPEATYLVWLDFRKLGLDNSSLEKLMNHTAGVALDHGYIFGKEQGSGFERINIACPRSVLEEGLKRIEKAVKSL